MSTSPSIIETIRQRRSYRSYEDRPLDPEVRASLQAALEHAPASPFGSQIRLALLESGEQHMSQPQKLGTYGVIKGARCFLAGAVDSNGHALEDFGYLFEWLILKATGLGLATCWLGGTVKRDSFAEAMQIGADEIVPAVSPVGHPRNRCSMVDRVFRLAARSEKRRPWSTLFFDSDFNTPLSEEAAGSYATVLEMIRLGPSASNMQPWRIVRAPQGAALHLFLQRTPGYGRAATVDLQRIDSGIAMCHLALTAEALELSGRWESLDPVVASLPERITYVISWIPD
jgi:nitroreductase